MATESTRTLPSKPKPDTRLNISAAPLNQGSSSSFTSTEVILVPHQPAAACAAGAEEAAGADVAAEPTPRAANSRWSRSIPAVRALAVSRSTR